MPTIPSLERRTVTPASRVTNIGVADIGSVGRELGGAIDRTIDKKNRYDLADAKSKFGILMHKQNSAYEQDNEYDTIEQRWDQSINEGVDEIAANIGDPELRNLFMMEARERTEASRPRINQLAFGKERDVKRSEMNTHLNGLREVVMGDDPDAARQAIVDAQDLYTAAAERGYVDYEESQKTIELWKQDAAVGRLRKIAPEDRVHALKDPLITGNIPSDKLAELQREADNAMLENQSMDVVDALGADFSLSRLYDTSEKIDDPVLRRKVEARGEAVFRQNRNAKLEQAEEFHQKEFVPVLLGEKELDINSPEFRELPVNYQTSLIKATEAKDSPAKRTDPWVQDKMMELYTKQEFTALREFYVDNIGKMSASDQAKWSKVSWDGVVPDDWKSKFTVMQRITSALTSADIADVNAKDRVMSIVNDWHESQIENGVKVTDKDIQAKIKESIAEVELNPEGVFGWGVVKGKKRYYTLTPEEREEMVGVTLKSYDKVNDDQLNIVIRDVLENRNDLKETKEAVQIGLSNPDRLSKQNQTALSEKLMEYDPDLSTQIYNAATSATGRTPSAAEFLRMYERARKSQ